VTTTLIFEASVGKVDFQKGSIRARALWMLGNPLTIILNALSLLPAKACASAPESICHTRIALP